MADWRIRIAQGRWDRKKIPKSHSRVLFSNERSIMYYADNPADRSYNTDVTWKWPMQQLRGVGQRHQNAESVLDKPYMFKLQGSGEYATIWHDREESEEISCAWAWDWAKIKKGVQMCVRSLLSKSITNIDVWCRCECSSTYGREHR